MKGVNTHFIGSHSTKRRVKNGSMLLLKFLLCSNRRSFPSLPFSVVISRLWGLSEICWHSHLIGKYLIVMVEVNHSVNRSVSLCVCVWGCVRVCDKDANVLWEWGYISYHDMLTSISKAEGKEDTRNRMWCHRRGLTHGHMTTWLSAYTHTPWHHTHSHKLTHIVYFIKHKQKHCYF